MSRALLPERRGLRLAAALLMTAVVAIVAILAARSWLMEGRPASPGDHQITVTASAEDGLSQESHAEIDLERIRPDVDRFCGGCHAVPSPESFPRRAWFKEVERGYYFYFQSTRSDLTPPPVEQVTEFFRSQAPERLKIPIPEHSAKASPITWQRESIDSAEGDIQYAISHLRWYKEAPSGRPCLLFTDMHLGAAGEIEWDNSRPVVRTLAALDFPAHIEPVDLNLDGAKGFLVAELGSREPADHDRGKVVWLRPETPEGFLSIPLQEGLGRVADVQAADFDGDGDGDLDLVVAEFGWHTTGRILLLRNQSGQGPEPQFTLEVVDERHGAIHVPVADLNRDGHPDFVALVSQEHEVVDAFLNKGDGTFWKERLYDAGDPSRGSSGIELIDIDGDGDLDVVHTNGDSFDSYYVKPYHGIRWLENTGSFPFLVHELTAFPGVHRAMAADLDGDGDMDIVACAFLPEQLEDGADRQAFNSVIWLEQVAPGQFVRHVIEHGNPSHATLVLADFDEDGDIDVVVGNFASNDGEASPLATIYWNERISNR